MKAKILLICAREKEYARRLAEYISGKHEYMFRVHYCDDPQTGCRLADKMHINYLLIDNAFPEEERQRIHADRCFALTEHPDEETGDAVPLFKYRTAGEILKEMVASCLEDGQITGKLSKVNQTQVIGFYSPVARTGQTRLALETGRKLAEEDAVLYLNLCPFAAGGHFETGEGSTLEDMIYYLRQDAPNPGLKLKALARQQDGVDLLLPFVMSEDLAEVEPFEWEKLLDVIEQETQYGAVVLDLGEGIRGRRDLLKRCDAVFMPVIDDALAAAKTEAFLHELTVCEETGLVGRIRKVPMAKEMSQNTRVVVQEIQSGREDSGNL